MAFISTGQALSLPLFFVLSIPCIPVNFLVCCVLSTNVGIRKFSVLMKRVISPYAGKTNRGYGHTLRTPPFLCYNCVDKWGRAGSTGDGLCRIAGRGATHRVKSGKKVTGNDKEFALAA